MMKKLLLAALALLPAALFAQYTTPNTGIAWNLEDLTTNAPAGVLAFADGVYTLSQNLTIAANDTFVIAESATLHIAPNVEITIAGTFNATADALTITAVNPATPYGTIRFEEGSVGLLNNATIDYGKGIRVATGSFTMHNCSMSYHVAGTTTGAALTFSQGSPLINASTFTNNVVPAFGSGANIESAPWFINNYLENNNTSNTNRPQINMGPSGNDTIRIIGNVIKGNPLLTLVGGISASSLLGNTNRVLIDGNTITNNRYGITVAGAASSGYIRNNTIEDNNTQNNPAQGGSGISLNATGAATMNIIATNNSIRRNLWGITVIGQARINLGSDAAGAVNPGGNVFADNGNGGQTYALFNNTPHPIDALYNCWIEGQNATADAIEGVISHQVDDPALGLVTFDPFNTDCALATENFVTADVALYPNPTSGNFTVAIAQPATVLVYSLNGQLLFQKELGSGENQLELQAPSGMYLLKLDAGGSSKHFKILKQ